MPTGVDDGTFLRASTHECHVIAWPPRQAGDPVLSDIVQGLD